MTSTRTRSAHAPFVVIAFATTCAAGVHAATPGADVVAGAAYQAAFVAQTVPSFIELFAPTTVSVTMRNTGTATWLMAEGDVFLATQEPQDNYYWCIQDNPHGMYSGNRVLLPSDVAPGASVTFSFVVKPLTCGFTATAAFRFRMLSQTQGTFGEETPDPGVHTSTAAEFVSQQAPDVAPAGARLGVKISFRNTTNVTWATSDGYALRSAGPDGNTAWGTASVALGESVAPGQVATFSFPVDVPGTSGTYNFQWRMSSTASGPFGQTSPPTSVKVVAAGSPNYGGLWWASPAASESGWGINLAHEGDVVFATWFTYDGTGKALWLSMSATKTASGVYSGTLVQTTGPAFDQVPFRPERVRTFSVGTGTLAFDASDTPFDANAGTFTYTLNGITQTKKITRQVFGTLPPTCTFALESDPARAYNFQDIWWAAPAGSEPGWGINLTHQDDVIFATWFTYDRDGTPLWFTVTAPKTASGSYAGTLYRTSGPPFFAEPFDPSRVLATPVGTASLAFTDGNAATFSWTVEGTSGEKSITREILETPGTICQ